MNFEQCNQNILKSFQSKPSLVIPVSNLNEFLGMCYFLKNLVKSIKSSKLLALTHILFFVQDVAILLEV